MAVSASAGPVGTSWDTETSGTLNGVTVTLSNVTNALILPFDLSGPAFASAPLASDQPTINVAALSDWTANFDEPVANLRLYIISWRGGAANPSPGEYTFDAPFVVLSGLSGASIAGNKITLPETQFHSGIIEFTAPVTTLNLDTNQTTFSSQLLTFGVAGLGPAIDGQVYDDVQGITWLQDANLFKTLCDASDPLATEFTPVDSNSAATICSNNGRMSWNDAEAWIARLNANNYLGAGTWRQPETGQPDASCSEQVAADGGQPAQGWGYRCKGSELGQLFNVTLGNPNELDDGCSPNCLVDAGPFNNYFQTLAHWSGTEYAPDPRKAWGFDPRNGLQSFGYNKVGSISHVWPVRSAADSDRDGIDDTLDNCVDTFNPGQLDADNDGVGNVCDPYNLCTGQYVSLDPSFEVDGAVYCAAERSIATGTDNSVLSTGRFIMSAPEIAFGPTFQVASGGALEAGANLAAPVPPEVYSVDFCRLQFPLAITESEGTVVDVYGRIYVAGLTDQSAVNDPAPGVIGYLGYGPDGTDPALDPGWHWTSGEVNPDYGPATPGYEANNDEYTAALIVPAAGTYDFAFRFSGDGGFTFTYCDGNPAGSSDGYLPTDAGQMTISAAE
jgi:hypothetical protein